MVHAIEDLPIQQPFLVMTCTDNGLSITCKKWLFCSVGCYSDQSWVLSFRCAFHHDCTSIGNSYRILYHSLLDCYFSVVESFFRTSCASIMLLGFLWEYITCIDIRILHSPHSLPCTFCIIIYGFELCIIFSHILLRITHHHSTTTSPIITPHTHSTHITHHHLTYPPHTLYNKHINCTSGNAILKNLGEEETGVASIGILRCRADFVADISARRTKSWMIA